MNKKLALVVAGIVVAFGLMVFATVVYVQQNREQRLTLSSASEIKEFLPVRAGMYTQWTSGFGPRVQNYRNVNEAICDNNNSYNSAQGNRYMSASDKDSYGLDISTIPDGATITSIEVVSCRPRYGWRSSRHNHVL